jgi:hypothetical protein
MGRGGAKNDAPATAEKMEVLVHGKYYDVTNMKHPGGSVIKFYAGKGIDATQAFDNFHVRSAKALKYMNSLPNREADVKEEKKKALPGQEALIKDFDEFTAQLKKEGFFEPNTAHIVYRIFEVFFMHALGGYLLFNGHYAAAGSCTRQATTVSPGASPSTSRSRSGCMALAVACLLPGGGPSTTSTTPCPRNCSQTLTSPRCLLWRFLPRW